MFEKFKNESLLAEVPLMCAHLPKKDS